jgi:hypothetical protein
MTKQCMRGQRVALSRIWAVLFGTCLWSSATAMTPLGPPIEIGEADFEVWHAVASAPDGRHVTVWLSDNQVRAQRFADTGVPLGVPFTVSAVTGGALAPRNEPAVTMDATGNFTVVWSEISPVSSSDARHLARRFRFDGTALTDVIVVDERAICTCGLVGIPRDFMAPVVAGGASGNFAVAWRERVLNGVDQVYMRRHAADGAPLGAATVVGTHTPIPRDDGRGNIFFPESPPSIASNAAGELAVAWGKGVLRFPSVNVRRYSADGAAQGPAKRVAGERAGVTSVALDQSGRFVVAWAEQTDGRVGQSPATTYRTRFRRYGAAGFAADVAQDLPDAGRNDLTRPRLAMDDAGNFVLIAWRFQQNRGLDDFPIKPLGQRYLANGTPDGPPFRYGGDNPSDGPLLANLASAADGRIVITWFNQRLDRDFSNPLATSLRVQRFVP